MSRITESEDELAHQLEWNPANWKAQARAITDHVRAILREESQPPAPVATGQAAGEAGEAVALARKLDVHLPDLAPQAWALLAVCLVEDEIEEHDLSEVRKGLEKVWLTGVERGRESPLSQPAGAKCSHEWKLIGVPYDADAYYRCSLCSEEHGREEHDRIFGKPRLHNWSGEGRDSYCRACGVHFSARNDERRPSCTVDWIGTGRSAELTPKDAQ